MKKVLIITSMIMAAVSADAKEAATAFAEHHNMQEAPAGFWGSFTKTPEPDFRLADGHALATNLNVAPEYVEMQPLAVNSKEGFPVDWQAAIYQAVIHHPSVQSSIATLESSLFNIDAARGGYLPSVKAGITSGRQEDEGHGQIATIGLSQMLYDFGKTGSSVDRAYANYLKQQAVVLSQVDTIIQQTALALNEVYRYRELVDNASQQIKALRDILKLIQLRAAAGASTRVDPVQAEARVKSAESQLQQLKIKLAQQKYHLQSLLGMPVEEKEVSAPFDLLPFIDQRESRLEINKNPAVLIALADAAIAEDELRGYKSQRYPTLSLEANSNKYR